MTTLLFKFDKETKKIKSRLQEVKFSPSELKEIRQKFPNCNDFYWLDEDGGKIFEAKEEPKEIERKAKKQRGVKE